MLITFQTESVTLKQGTKRAKFGFSYLSSLATVLILDTSIPISRVYDCYNLTFFRKYIIADYF